MSTVVTVRKKRESEIAAVAERLQRDCDAQEAAARTVHGAARLGRSITGASIVSSQMLSGTQLASTFHLACEKRWSPHFQRLCDDPKLELFEKVKRIDEFLAEFGAFAEATAKGFLDQYLSDDAGDIKWATPQHLADGDFVSVVMLDTDDNSASAVAAREQAAQYRFLAQQLVLMGSSKPLVHVHPRVVVQYNGRALLFKTDAAHEGARLTTDQNADFELALSVVCESLRLSKYSSLKKGGAPVGGGGGKKQDASKKQTDRHNSDESYEAVTVGPPGALCVPGHDGRLYVDTLDCLQPYFPPARGTPVSARKHTLRLRCEAVTSPALSDGDLSPAAFLVFGARDSVANNSAVRLAASRVCQSVLPRLAEELHHEGVPVSGRDLSERLHRKGANVAMLGLLLSHVADRESETFRDIVTEMACRAARDYIRTLMCTRIEQDDIIAVVSEFFAAFNSDETSEVTWTEGIVPIMKNKFMGFGSLFGGPEGSPNAMLKHTVVDRVVMLERLQELMGFSFSKGVSPSGTSAFHYCIAESRAVAHRHRLPPFVVGYSLYLSQGTLSPAMSPKPLLESQRMRLAWLNQPKPASEAAAEEAAVQLMMQRQKEVGTKSIEYGFACLEIANVLRERYQREQQQQQQSSDGGGASSSSTAAAATSSSSALLTRAEKCIDIAATAFKGLPNNCVLYGLLMLERGELKAARRSFSDAVKDLNGAFRFFTTVLFADQRGELSQSQQENNQEMMFSASGVQQPGATQPSSNASQADGESSEPQVTVYGMQAASSLANWYEEHGLREEAEPLRRYVLATAKTLHGDVDEAVSGALNDLAVNLFSQEQMREAEELFREDLEVTEKLFGKDHLNVANTLNNLACLLDRMGDHGESEALFRRDIAISSKALGEQHPDVATSKNNLASSLLERSKFGEAEALFQEALASRRAFFGETHVAVAETLNNIGALHKRNGDLPKAKAVWGEALQVYEKSCGRHHHSLQQVLENMQALSEEMEEPEAAEELMERLMDLKRAENDVYNAQQSAVS